MNKKTSILIVVTVFLISCLCIVLLNFFGKKKEYIVGIVNPSRSHDRVLEGFKRGMTSYGFIENENIVYLYKGVLPDEEVGLQLAEFIRNKVDLILAISGPVAIQAQKATEKVPVAVVAAPVLYPLEIGLVKSLRHPGGNVTGIQVGGSTKKALEFLKRSFPAVKVLYVPCWCGDSGSELSLADLKVSAEMLGISLLPREIKSADELRAVLEKIPSRANALWLLNSSSLVSHIDLFTKAALNYKLPLASGTSQYGNGVMISYAQDPFSTGEQAARLAHKILEGTLPGNLPVEQAHYKLGINLKMAEAIGLRIPDDVLQMADDIVR